MTILRAAACHVSPVYLSARETTQKAISLIHQASSNSANLIVFPESYIPAFPHWSSLRAPCENHVLFKRMAQESLLIDGEEIRAIRHAAKTTKSIVSLGISEKARYSSATLFNSNVIIGSDGEILVHHRKLMPTFFEKLTWGPGDGFGLRVAETAVGKIGALICGENTNPLARYALMAQGEQIHISSWPAIWPTRMPAKSAATTVDALAEFTGQAQVAEDLPIQAKGINYDNIRANKTRAAAHCFEAKCFGIMCSGHLSQDAILTATAAAASTDVDSSAISAALEVSPRGATMFLDPTGASLPAFVIDPKTGEKKPTEFLQNEEDILYADMDLGDCIEGKQYHDVVGGYQRFDIFDLKVDRRRREPVGFTDEVVKE